MPSPNPIFRIDFPGPWPSINSLADSFTVQDISEKQRRLLKKKGLTNWGLPTVHDGALGPARNQADFHGPLVFSINILARFCEVRRIVDYDVNGVMMILQGSIGNFKRPIKTCVVCVESTRIKQKRSPARGTHHSQPSTA